MGTVEISFPRDVEEIGGLVGCQFAPNADQLDSVAFRYLAERFHHKSVDPRRQSYVLRRTGVTPEPDAGVHARRPALWH